MVSGTNGEEVRLADEVDDLMHHHLEYKDKISGSTDSLDLLLL